MTSEEFNKLDRGDIVRHHDTSTTFVVTANYGDRVTAVATADMTNAPEWVLVRKSQQADPN